MAVGQTNCKRGLGMSQNRGSVCMHRSNEESEKTVKENNNTITMVTAEPSNKRLTTANMP